MKKELITLLLLNSVLVMNAQWNGTTTSSNVGIGTTEPPSTKLEIVGSSQAVHQVGTLKLKSAIANQFLYIGYDDNYSAGYIQSVKPGTSQQNILLAPQGGNIGIGLTNPDRKLTVEGLIGTNNGGVMFKKDNKIWDITSNNNDLSFNETGTSTRLFLQSGGNIGIGTNNPNSKLEIVGSSLAGHDIGTLKLKSSIANQFIYMGYDDKYSAGYIQSVKPGTSQQNILLAPNGGNIGIGLVNPTQTLTVAGQIGVIDGGLIFKSDTKVWDINPKKGGLSFNETGIISPLFLQSGGNIGIGTDNPSTKLEIVGSSLAGYEIGTLKLKSSIANQFIYMGYDDKYSAGYIQSVKPGTSQQNILLAPNGGNIGIGTYTPTYKLDVCGTIRAQEIKVDMLSGCDFVFKDDYKLMNLNDLEKFIKTNQHLPEVASEKEMIENGVNMKEFQMKLLQKIEELTLYTIEQNKKIQSLERIVMKSK
ncbi:hypothetical protein LPB87_19605 [Flavobacterium sp. EDS]|uniref:hypothetical protein n=1 Tax=Flavobacterium sp. EDS TaxID=2897328 RepID=UPI001E5FF665|nr:hypothetical protein [Flavobacterium sp. EDS]MCD0476606.1 hypothetical protein [Flavobacterium sp. EDS]